MQKFILVPDSFKGTISSKRICEIMSSCINKAYTNPQIISVPVADGGEGSVDCFLSALGGNKIGVECKNPYFEDVESFYGLLSDGKTAVIEMAAAAGLPMVEDRKNPLLTTTYGVGQLIKHAIKNGASRIIVGLGGSCTNDFGCGAACALGVKFFDKDGKEFIPVGQSLKDICSIDFSKKDSDLNKVEIISMCDIDNPPYGIRGAAKVFAPQKGADPTAVQLLDDGVKSLCDLLNDKYGVDLSTLKGGGAEGAMGAGMVAFFNSNLKMGIDTVLDTVGFDNMIDGATAIFTGEGKLDSQSLGGKVVIGVSRRAKKQNVPVIAIVGGADSEISAVYEQGVSAVFTINRLPQDLSISRYKSEENLAFTMENVLRSIKTFLK